MSQLILVSSDKLVQFALENDIKNYNFIVISRNIRNSGEFNNVFSIPPLIPPSAIMANYINGDKNKYRERYFSYLTSPLPESLITTLVKLLLIDDSNVVLICSEMEKEYKYINMIAEYIYTVYGISSVKFKKYMKDKKDELVVKDKEAAIDILKKKLSEIRPEHIKTAMQMDKSALSDKLKKVKKKELLDMCKSRKIKIKKDKKNDKKYIIKKLIKEYCD
jgi:recombinational DNA repair ATPase RecF